MGEDDELVETQHRHHLRVCRISVDSHYSGHEVHSTTLTPPCELGSFSRTRLHHWCTLTLTQWQWGPTSVWR